MSHLKKRLQLSHKGKDSFFLQRRLQKLGLGQNQSQNPKFRTTDKKISSLFRFSGDASPRGLKGEIRVKTEIAPRFFSNLKKINNYLGEKAYFEVNSELYEMTISDLKISKSIFFLNFMR